MYMPSLFGESLFDGFFGDFARPVRREPKFPEFKFPEPDFRIMKTDVKETETGFELDIELPGYNKEDIKAELKDGYLTISVQKEKNEEQKDDEGRFIRRERYQGSCSRCFYVGENVTEKDIQAKFEQGVLIVFVPKIEKNPELEQKKLIEIA